MTNKPFSSFLQKCLKTVKLLQIIVWIKGLTFIEQNYIDEYCLLIEDEKIAQCMCMVGGRETTQIRAFSHHIYLGIELF
jgi:hypothetical protein